CVSGQLRPINNFIRPKRHTNKELVERVEATLLSAQCGINSFTSVSLSSFENETCHMLQTLRRASHVDLLTGNSTCF
ncbi:unnamed protein product, partial [Mycena citricolor]